MKSFLAAADWFSPPTLGRIPRPCKLLDLHGRLLGTATSRPVPHTRILASQPRQGNQILTALPLSPPPSFACRTSPALQPPWPAKRPVATLERAGCRGSPAAWEVAPPLRAAHQSRRSVAPRSFHRCDT